MGIFDAAILGIVNFAGKVIKRVSDAVGFRNRDHVVHMGRVSTSALGFETAVAITAMILIWSVKIPGSKSMQDEFRVVNLNHTYWAPLSIICMNAYYFLAYFLLPVLYVCWIYLLLRIFFLIWWCAAFFWISIQAAVMTMASAGGAPSKLPWTFAWRARVTCAAVFSGFLVVIMFLNLCSYGMHLHWHRERNFPYIMRYPKTDPPRRTYVVQGGAPSAAYAHQLV
ncbi:hypothetical protein P154DRAFT_614815 [Amniculicola lignicola CBS 123094]|uniref:Uncharacterized protein n=1 Tax=Amniculicola lignicola CBS 123094 TaxID=1392246 RepID=A0A6A5X3H0_9PLEO|nr:hypothetical protein P154DRAFT_614815 [Amniculicola lignicola CBS 123094]